MSGMNSVNDRLADAEADNAYDNPMIGVVTENVDPLGINRIKVKIVNVLDVDQGPVPWCLPSPRSPFGQGSGYGVYGSPKLGSLVRIKFQGGDPQCPIYECEVYTKANANPKFKDPDTWGFKDPAGNELFVNMTTGQWEWTHQSGDSLKYDGQGNVTYHVVKDVTTQIDGDDTVSVAGDRSVEIQGNLSEDVTGDVTKTYNQALNLTVVGNATVAVQGNLSATVGGTASIVATGAMNLSGNPINLN